MVQLSQKEFDTLKSAYEFSKSIKALQKPLNKYEVKELRSLIKKHIDKGYSSYLRVVSVYEIDRDKNLSIYVRSLLQSLQVLEVTEK